MAINEYVSGALGKRTKFQQEDLAQLTLRVEVGENVGHDDSEATLPVDVKLEDEVQLNKIKFKNQEDGEHPNLTGLHQAIILAVL